MNTIETRWQFGKYRIAEEQDKIDKLFKVADLIRHAEQRYENNKAWEEGPFGSGFPNLSNRWHHQAEITRAAHARLVRYFNNLSSEISL